MRSLVSRFRSVATMALLAVVAGVLVVQILTVWHVRRQFSDIRRSLSSVTDSLTKVAESQATDANSLASVKKSLSDVTDALNVLNGRTEQLAQAQAKAQAQAQTVANKEAGGPQMTPEYFREFGSLKLADLDVRSSIRFKTRDQAEALRKKIRAFVWRGAAPGSVEKVDESATVDTPLNAIRTVAAVETWRFQMHYGIASKVFFLRATINAGCLFLYHDGHSYPSIYDQPRTIDIVKILTAKGCDIVLLSMPLYGVNKTEPITVDGREIVFDFPKEMHDRFYELDRPDFSALRYFVDPVIATLNKALKRRSYRRIGMGGLSGGGWTAMFVAAIEPRFTHIYPVAGSVPFLPPDPNADMRITRWRGDYETALPRFYDHVANYFDLYVLGGIYEKRRGLHIYDKNDECCVPSVYIYAFRRQVEAIIREMSGNSVLFVSDEVAVKHELSTHAEDLIVEDFLR